jgi:putative ABC transport system permease protein
VKYFGLVWKNVWRKKVRASLTILSVLVAFVLFALLSAVGYAFKMGVEYADPRRLAVINNMSLINPLPISYKNKLATVPGVIDVTHASWFGAFYQDPPLFAQFATEPRAWFEMHPELTMPEEQLDAWARNRIGIVAGEELIKQYGWKVGDRIPLQTTIWTNKDGQQTWEFVLEGIFSTDEGPQGRTAYMLFHHDYFEEARAFGEGSVGWYVLRIANDVDAAAIASSIDDQFANSPYPTETSTEAAFAESFAKQLGDVGLIVRLVLGAVFFTLLLLAGNTMAQSVRERISELAVLKTLGFPDRSVLRVVLWESVLIMFIGGFIGLALGWVAVQVVAENAAGTMPGVYLTPQAILAGILLMVIAGIAAGVFPALKAMRLSIVDALARG